MEDNNNSNEKPSPKSSGQSDRQKRFQEAMELVLVKLKLDPGNITTEDARCLSENSDARDTKSVRIISAVQSFAAANENLHEQDLNLEQAPLTSLLTLVTDLNAAVENSPDKVTDEVLDTAQSIVSKMQKAVGHSNVPHLDLETEPQEEIASIVPKVEQDTATKVEADRLCSPETRAHGQTEKGGVSTTAQSSVSNRRHKSLSDRSNISGQISEADYENRQEQSHYDKDLNLKISELAIDSDLGEKSVGIHDTQVTCSRDHRVKTIGLENSQPVPETSH